MRAYIVLIMIISITSGCASPKENKLESAIHVAGIYKKTELEAIYNDEMDEVSLEQIRSKEEKLRPLTTASFFRKKSADRIFVYSMQIAQIKKADLRLADVAFEERESDDPSVIKLNYDGVLHIGEESMNISGRIELIEEGETWKVNYDSYNIKDILKIIDNSIIQAD